MITHPPPQGTSTVELIQQGYPCQDIFFPTLFIFVANFGTSPQAIELKENVIESLVNNELISTIGLRKNVIKVLVYKLLINKLTLSALWSQ